MSLNKLEQLEKTLVKLRTKKDYHSEAEVNLDIDYALALLREYRGKRIAGGLKVGTLELENNDEK